MFSRPVASGSNPMLRSNSERTDPVTPRVWQAARRCHDALGCRDYSLFDFRIDPGGQPWFLEAGLYCSFARTSVIAVMAAAAGIPLPDLFQLAIRESTARNIRL